MFFGSVVEPGVKSTTEADLDLHVSMAAVRPQASGKPVSLYLTREEENEDGDKEKKEFLLCTLHPQNVYQVALDLTFIEGETLSFHVEGDSKVHLTGYYMPDNDFIDDEAEEYEPSEGEEEEEMSEEEIESEKTSPVGKAVEKKRPNVSAVKEQPAAKKLKSSDTPVANGKKPKPFEEDEAEEDDGEEDEDDSEEDEDLSKLLAGIKKANGKAGGDKLDDDDDDEDDDEEEDMDDDDEEESDEDEEEDEVEVKKQQQKLKDSLKKPEVEKKESAQKNEKQGDSKKQNQFSGQKKFGGDNKQSPQGQNRGGKFTPNSGGFNRNSPNSGGFNRNNSPNNNRGGFRGGFGGGGRGRGGGFTPGSGGNKFGGNKGLVVNDITEGQGPLAKDGKVVTVSYVGKIGNKVFDQNKKFSFKLGKGEVIKGWDMGVKNMKVGGKRVLEVPPEFGYGSRRTGPIPANSQLHFEVELKHVS